MARLSRGRPLQTVALAALQHFGLVDKLALPPAKLSAFLQVRRPRGQYVVVGDWAVETCILLSCSCS